MTDLWWRVRHPFQSRRFYRHLRRIGAYELPDVIVPTFGEIKRWERTAQPGEQWHPPGGVPDGFGVPIIIVPRGPVSPGDRVLPGGRIRHMDDDP